jgi:hypothetical protein
MLFIGPQKWGGQRIAYTFPQKLFVALPKVKPLKVYDFELGQTPQGGPLIQNHYFHDFNFRQFHFELASSLNLLTMHTLEKRNCDIEKKEKISKSPPFPQIRQYIIVYKDLVEHKNSGDHF